MHGLLEDIQASFQGFGMWHFLSGCVEIAK